MGAGLTAERPVVGLLHPGAMGVAVDAALSANGSRIVWASEGRSRFTSERAADAGIEDVGTLAQLVHAAETRVAGTVAEAWRFEGEMHGIADAFAAEGVPDGFYLAAAEVYRRIAPLRGPDAPDRPAEIANVLHEARTSVTPRTKQASYGRFKP